MRCVIQVEGWLVTRYDQAESDLKDYGEETRIIVGRQALWESASWMGGVTKADWVTARPNLGEPMTRNLFQPEPWSEFE